MAAIIFLLAVGAAFVVVVVPFIALGRAGRARRRAEEADERLAAMERLVEKLRAEVVALRTGPSAAASSAAASAAAAPPRAEVAAPPIAAIALPVGPLAAHESLSALPLPDALAESLALSEFLSKAEAKAPSPSLAAAEPPAEAHQPRKPKQPRAHREPEPRIQHRPEPGSHKTGRKQKQHKHAGVPETPPDPDAWAPDFPVAAPKAAAAEALSPIADNRAPHLPAASSAQAPAQAVVEALHVNPTARPERGSTAEVQAAVASYSAWSEAVRPFLVENIGWFIGGFLVIAGSLYGIREAWGAFEAVGKHLLAVVVLLGYAAAFVGVGLWLKKKQALPTASRAMAYVGLSLLPVSVLSAADLFASSRLGWALVLPLTIAAAWPVLYLAGGLLDRPLAKPLANGLAAILVLLGLVPAAAAFSPGAALALPYLAWAVVHSASGAPLRGTTAPRAAAIAFHLAALSYGLAFVVGLAHVIAGRAPDAPPLPAAYGPLLVLLSLTALRIDVELRARWKGAPEVDVAVVAAFAATLGGVMATMQDPPLFALSAALAAALFALGLRWYRRPLLLVFSLAAGAAAYATLVFVVPPISALRESAGRLFSGSGWLTARPSSWAFLLLPLAEAATRLANRYRARKEPRLVRAAEAARWAILAATVGFAFTAPQRGVAVNLLATAAVCAVWHLRLPQKRTAWMGALALAIGVALIPEGSIAVLPLALGVAAAVALALALPGLRASGPRLGSTALLSVAAIFAAMGAVGSPVLSSIAVDVGLAGAPDWRLPVALCAAVWAVAAVAFSSVAPGVVAAAAAALLLGGGLFGRDLVPAFNLRSGPLWLAVPAALFALGLALRFAAGKVRSRPPFLFGSAALPWRARGLHALSEPLLWASWFTAAAVAWRALSAGPVQAAVLLCATGALFLLLGRVSRAGLGPLLAAASLVAAGALLGPALLGVRQGSAGLGAAFAGVVGFGLCWIAERDAFRARLGRRSKSARPVGTGLFAVALLCSAAALVVDFGAAGLLERNLASVAAIFALGALSFGSAWLGFVAAAAASALTARVAFGSGDLLAPFVAASPAWLALLAGQIALAAGLRFAARKVRGSKPWFTLAGLPRARSLHALAVPLHWAAWSLLSLLSLRGVLLRDLRGAALLAGAAVAAAILGAAGRKQFRAAAGGVAAAAFAAAGAAFSIGRTELALGPAALGVILGAAAVALISLLAGKGRRWGAVAAGARPVASAAIALGAAAAILGTLPLLTNLVSGLSIAAPQTGSLALALLLATGALLVIGGTAVESFLALTAAAAACLAGVAALGLPQTAVGALLAVLAIAGVWTERLLRGRGEISDRLGQPLILGAPFFAALAFAASFLPPAETFAAPLRQASGLHLGHIPTDLLLVGFLLSALAARTSTIFLHLLFIELAVTATRVRLSLDIPTRGHGMVLAGGALLVLAVLIRGKPRHSKATLWWTAAALAGGWARMLFFPPQGFALDTQEWLWALAAAVLALPLAKLLWSRATALAAAGGLAAAILAGVSQAFPAWFAQAWPMAAAAIALGFAGLSMLLDRQPDARVPFLARAETAGAFRVSGGLLAALGGGFAGMIAAGAAVRQSAPLSLAVGVPIALTLGLAAAAAFLTLRSARRELAIPAAMIASTLAVTSVAAPLLTPLVGPCAPVLVLIVLAVAARELARVEGLRAEMSVGAAGLWIASLLATRAAPDEWTTAAAVAAGALVLRGASIVQAVAKISLPTWLLLAGAGFELAWAAPRIPLAAEVGVPAGLALLGLLAACLHEWRASRTSSTSLDATLLAVVSAGLLVVAGLSAPLWARAGAISGGVGLGVVLLTLRAFGGAPAALDVALAALAALYVYFRARMGLGDGVADLDRNAVLASAAALVLVGRLLKTARADLSAPLARGAAVLPIALLPFARGADFAPAAGGAALVYGLLAFVHRSKAAAIAGLVLANVFFVFTWRQRGVADAQLYTIPIGASLLLAAQLSRRDLPKVQLQWLRALGCVVLYAGTAFQMAGSDSLTFPLLLCGLALATVVLGVGLQIRSFVYLGTATLVVTVLANLVRYSARSSRVLAVSATLTGLAIMGGMAYFSVRREQALQLYRRLVRGMDDWE